MVERVMCQRKRRMAVAALAAWGASATAQPASSVTAAQHEAAFPDLGGMSAAAMMAEDPMTSFVLVDQLERREADGGDPLAWNVRGWIGHNLDKLWMRSEGSRVDGHTEDAELELLWGHAIARWWDLVVGAREVLRPTPSEHWAAIGVQGLAPYRFDVEATAYLASGGRAALRIESEYELRITNRWFLQPRLEINWYGSDEVARGVGRGLSRVDAGLRLRYEVRREFAPYVGIVKERIFGKTSDIGSGGDEESDDTRIVAGLRFWF